MKLQILDTRTTNFNKYLFNETAHTNGEPYWVRPLKPHFNEIGIDVVIEPFYKIDKTKNWFISLAPFSWNWEHNIKTNLLSNFDFDVQNELIYGNGYFIINHECESFTNSFIAKIYSALEHTPIKPNKIIYMVAAPDVEKTYERFVSDKQLLSHERITVMNSCHVCKNIQVDTSVFDNLHITKKEKKFLSLNRTSRDHRVMLVSLLAEYDLLQYGFVSLGMEQNEVDSVFNNLHNIKPTIPQSIKNGFKKIKDILPLKIDNIDLNINQWHIDSLPTYFYTKSYFSVVSSTFALAYQEPSVGFSEKEIKPILYKHPFLLLNLPGALQHLKNMGFLTFSKWFDETYDYESDDYKRLNKIVREISRLSKISDSNWDIMLDEMRPVLLHNFNRLVKYNTEHSFFNSDLKNFLYYVS